MKLFRFGHEVSTRVDAYKSSGFTISRIAHLFGEAVINCAYLEADGMIGYHQAASPQLFLIVQGEGWVRDETSERIPVRWGEAAYWEKDEWRESGTETLMTAIIVESSNFDLSKLVPAV